MRVLAMMGVSTDPDSKFILLDDGLVHRFSLMTHFWFDENSLNKPKANIA
jgi:molybdopterin/thiamine biosynthesis adenylyltransferase